MDQSAEGSGPRGTLLRGRLRKALDGGREAQHEAERSLLEARISELESEVVELRVKVDCRNMAIASLERTAEMQGETVQALHLELEEARQAQSKDELEDDIEALSSNMEEMQIVHERRGEELRALQSSMEEMQIVHERREEELQFEADRLRKRVHDKKKLVVSLTKKLTECQRYIGELTDELERVYKEH